MSCCKRMVTIEMKTIHLNRGAAFCTKPRACSFFFFPKDDKALGCAKGILAPNQDVVFEVIEEVKRISTGSSVA